MRNLNLLLSAVLAFSSLLACTEKEENIYLIQMPRKTSAIGFVSLYDGLGLQFTDQSGVTVSVKDLTPPVQAVSDYNGRFKLDSLEEGNYILHYQKAGFGEYEIGVRVTAGGNQPYLISQYYYSDFGLPWQNVYIPLYQASNLVPGPASVYINPSPDTLNPQDSLMVVRGSITPPISSGMIRSVVMLVDTVSTISPSQYAFSANGTAMNGQYKVMAPIYQRKTSFKPGKTYYARVYGAPYNSNPYIDRATGRYVLNGLNPNPTSVFSFQVR